MSDVTPASEWGSKGEVVTLPSGKTARLRTSFPARMLIRSGQIDQETLAALEQASQGGLADPSKALEIIGVVCEGMFLEPRVTIGGDEGTVALDDIDDDDQDFVLDRAFGGAPTEAFPDKQDGHVSGKDSKVLGNAPKRPARARKRQPAGARAR